MEFTDLPPEMVAAIIDHIPIPERHITRLISTQFRDICHDKSRKIKQEGDMSIAAAFGDTIAILKYINIHYINEILCGASYNIDIRWNIINILLNWSKEHDYEPEDIIIDIATELNHPEVWKYIYSHTSPVLFANVVGKKLPTSSAVRVYLEILNSS